MKRAKQGVPLETFDLHSFTTTNRAVELLSEIVVDVPGRKETFEGREEMRSMDDPGRGLIVKDDSSREDYGDDEV